MGTFFSAIFKFFWWLVLNWLVLPITLHKLIFPNGSPEKATALVQVVYLISLVGSYLLVPVQGVLLFFGSWYLIACVSNKFQRCDKCRKIIHHGGEWVSRNGKTVYEKLCDSCKSTRIKEDAERKIIEAENQLIEGRRRYKEQLASAKRFEISGRFEDAAVIYESLAQHKYGDIDPDEKYLEEAGRVRRKARIEYVRTTAIDINSLIPQLKELAKYKCPQCGAGIGINNKTSPQGLKFCGHCGSALNLDLISEFLQKLL